MFSGFTDFNDLQPISAKGTSLCYPCVTHNTSPSTYPVTACTLTDRHIRTLNPTERRVDHFDRTVTGLALRLSVSGRKTWCVFFRVNRRLRRMTLGHYPAVTLHAARTKARQVVAEVALHGTDPAAHRLDTRHGPTVADLADEYLTRHAKPHKKSWQEDQRIITRELLPHWRHRLHSKL